MIAHIPREFIKIQFISVHISLTCFFSYMWAVLILRAIQIIEG